MLSAADAITAPSLSLGALAPLLCALPTLRDDSPFILVALHGHRYVAFISQC